MNDEMARDRGAARAARIDREPVESTGDGRALRRDAKSRRRDALDEMTARDRELGLQ